MSDEDLEAWHQMIRGVKRLPTSEKLPKPPSAKRIRITPKKTSLPQPLIFSPTPLTPGFSPDVDKSTLQKLKQGKLPLEGTLDLHGHTEEQAYRELTRFIMNGYEQGRRCVLIITGKGMRADGTRGVIRERVPSWLNEELRRYVLAFAYAKAKEGGEGALYVLLKRKK